MPKRIMDGSRLVRAIGDGQIGNLLRVYRFWEKPSLSKAHSLWRLGCLWNTFVTIGRAGALLELLRSQVPHLLERLGENDLESVYQAIEPADFSRDVLTPSAHRLLVVRDAASGWADLGNPNRVGATLVKNRVEPAWLYDATNVEWA
jgi:mannose-1-phosphate guanylyltransferase